MTMNRDGMMAVVSVEWLELEIKCLVHDYPNSKTGLDVLLSDIHLQVEKKGEKEFLEKLCDSVVKNLQEENKRKDENK